MSPITSQPVKAMAEKTKITNSLIGVLSIHFVALALTPQHAVGINCEVASYTYER
jgi:hypothetical protein